MSVWLIREKSPGRGLARVYGELYDEAGRNEGTLVLTYGQCSERCPTIGCPKRLNFVIQWLRLQSLDVHTRAFQNEPESKQCSVCGAKWIPQLQEHLHIDVLDRDMSA